MTRIFCIIATLLIISGLPVQAEKNLMRPPGTTRYAPMMARLHALLDFDQSQGAHRMSLTSIGTSIQGREIWLVTIHGGPTRIYYQCRQHGHEPASTEGALAFLDQLVHAETGSPLDNDLKHATVYVVPMANPDGAEAFLRHNAHDVDPNRDWIKQSQPETRAWVQAIKRIHPDLMTDQHELYPDDTRPDFTETVGAGSGAALEVIATGLDDQRVIQGAMLAEGFPTVAHHINDRHPPRLAHRYCAIALGIPTLLFETNRLTARDRSVADRAAAHTQFMIDVLRAGAGERPQMIAEADAWRAAHVTTDTTPSTTETGSE
jgi:predicted deacylase